MRTLFSILIAVAASTAQAANLGHNRQCTEEEVASLRNILGCQGTTEGVTFTARQRRLATAVLVTLASPGARCEEQGSRFLPSIASNVSSYYIQNDHRLYRVEITANPPADFGKVLISDFND